MVALTGCAPSGPTYDEVRAEAKDAVQEIVDLLPGPVDAVPRPEQEPYPCDMKIALMSGKGAFYTTSVDITLPAGTDVPAIMNALPEQLGDGWAVKNTTVQTPLDSYGLVRTSDGTHVEVFDASDDHPGVPAMQLTVLSRCGALEGN